MPGETCFIYRTTAGKANAEKSYFFVFKHDLSAHTAHTLTPIFFYILKF